MGSLESDTTERLHFHFSLSCNGEGNGNPLQCSCLENFRDGEAWWAAVYGVAQSRTRLKWRSSKLIYSNAMTVKILVEILMICCKLILKFSQKSKRLRRVMGWNIQHQGYGQWYCNNFYENRWLLNLLWWSFYNVFKFTLHCTPETNIIFYVHYYFHKRKRRTKVSLKYKK